MMCIPEIDAADGAIPAAECWIRNNDVSNLKDSRGF